jgi:hypothetical protein|nr:MAG TPA: hypothetical protein [Caudoviricetes sp.]
MAISSDAPVMTMPVAPTSANGGFGGFGGDGWWIILFFIVLFGWGGNGWGGNNGGVMDGYVLTSDFANIERKLDNVNNGLCDGFYAMNTGMLNGFAGVTQAVTNGFYASELSRCNQQAALMQQLNAMQMQAQECCCENRAAIAQVRYDMATQACDTRNTVQNATRDIIDNANSNSKAILDFLVNSKMQDLQTENQNLKLAASQAAQNNYLVSQLRPCPTPAYITCNPWASSAPCGACGSCA